MTHYVVKRLGFQPTRGWVVLFVIVAALAAAAFWIGPFRAAPARLQLLALSGDGRFREFVGIPAAWADTLPPASEATARFPLILAVYNAGAQSARPTQLALSLPARFRVSDQKGQPLPFQRTIGNPLVRYELPVRTAAVAPRHQPQILPGLDTLWLEPIVPAIYCTALADSVPEFVSAPQQDARTLSRVHVFYSFSGPRIKQRQAGLLTVQVDPNLVKRDPAPSPPIYPTQVTEPEAARPEMSELRYVGSRLSWCGDPGQPVEIYDALYQTAEGGRFFVLYHGGAPRKYLFDLDRDSIIELEMWDQDGNGRFESRRPARMAIPAFLMPYREAVTDTMAADTALADTTFTIDTVPATAQWLRTFYDTSAGPLRFGGKASAPRAVPVPAAAPAAVQPVSVDSAALRLFNNTAAGPFRFYRALHGIPEPKPKPRETGPRLLGVPVEEVRPQQRAPRERTDTGTRVRRDSTARDTLRSDTIRVP